MRSCSLSSVIAILALLASSCDSNPAGPGGASTDAFIDALRAQGLSVSRNGTLDRSLTPYFTPQVQIVAVNGQDLQVYEYDSDAAAASDAANVSADGSTIGATHITWAGVPHFYRNGRLIVLYVGGNNAVLQALEKELGPRFAGR